VEEVEGFAFGQGLVGVEELDFGDDAAALEGEGGARADAAAAADDGDFHDRRRSGSRGGCLRQPSPASTGVEASFPGGRGGKVGVEAVMSGGGGRGSGW